MRLFCFLFVLACLVGVASLALTGICCNRFNAENTALRGDVAELRATTAAQAERIDAIEAWSVKLTTFLEFGGTAVTNFTKVPTAPCEKK